MTKVLLVDDDEAIRLTVRTVLEANGFEVVGEAKDGQDGVKKFASVNPDLVLLDIDMPKMSGMEALREMLKHNEDAVIIMLTSVAVSSVVDDCLLFGAKDYVRKDTPASGLVEKIKEVLAKQDED